MSKKINIMCEVDEDVYAHVVVPNKADKRFSRLITALIKGYYDNSSIRAYVDGIMDGQREAQNSILDKLIEDMKQSMMNQGMCLDDAKVIAQEGMDTFNSNEKQRESSEETASSSSVKDMVKEETADLRDAINELKEQNKAIFDAIKGLSAGMSFERGSDSSSFKPVEREQTESVVLKQNNVPPQWTKEEDLSVKTSLESPKQPTTYDDDMDDEEIIPLKEVEDDKENSIDGKDLLEGLLAGNSFSF